MSFGEGILCSILGMLVVFFGLICLQVVIHLITAASKVGGKTAPAEGPAEEAPALASETSAAAPGSAGDVKLYGVADRDAAMIMAIVADRTGKPLNELRFKSIREVK